MRKINKIIIHCSDSDNPRHDNIKTIDQWHKARGWRGVGYHYFIRANGTLELGRKVSEAGAHTYGQNGESLGVCLHGKERFTEAQFLTLRKLIRNLRRLFKPLAVYGHCEFNAEKTCPNFDYKTEIINKLDLRE